MSGSLSFSVQTTVDIFPRSGGSYTMGSGNAYLRAVSTSKDIGQPFGQFQIALSPGGPSGTSGQTWTQLITPMSLCLISITRGNYKQTVMVGVVLNVTESQDWSKSIPERTTTIQGADLSYLFATRSYYSLAAVVGSPLGGLPNVDQLAIVAQGSVSGTPASVCQSWFNSIIFGKTGILSGVKFQGQEGQVALSGLMGTRFDAFDAPIEIPYGANYIGDETSFLAKLSSFLEAPFYELFITTSAPGFYSGTSATTPLSSPSSAQYPDVQTTIVGRVNPFPRLKNTGSPTIPKWTVDSTLWQGLPTFQIDTASFIESSVTFSCDAVKNWYMIVPSTIGTLYGAGNSQLSGATSVQLLLADFDSRNAYGYAPSIHSTQWLYDPDGVQAQRLAQSSGDTDFQALYQDLLARLVAYDHPTYLMAIATVTLPLRPDVMPGCVFSYVPFKDGVLWDFYISGVQHSVQPPQGGATTLTLSRGLPHSVYNDAATLQAVLLGQADRVNGAIVAGQHVGIVPINLGDPNINVSAYSSPQGGKAPTS